MLYGLYSPYLIILSFLIAIISSYTTLVLIERMSHINSSKKLLWLFSGSLVMGTGIFSIHFIVMAAFHIDYPLTYNPVLLFIALLIAILSSYAAFYIINVQPLTKKKQCLSGIIYGLGIVLLHYVGTIATNEPIEIQYKSIYFILSIVISIGFSSFAIKIFAKLKNKPRLSLGRNVLIAMILGITIFSMNYTGIRATRFISHQHEEITTGVDTFTLGSIISFTTLFIMVVALFSVFLDYRSLQREKHLSIQIKESEERYRRLVEDSPEPLLVMNEQKILFVNEVCLNLIDVPSKSEIIGKPIMDFVHLDFKEIVLDRMQSIREGRSVGPMEQKLVTPNGSVIDVEVSPVGIIYEGKPAFQIVIKDITEQKRLRRALEESRQKYKSLFDHNPDAVYSMDSNGYFTDINPSVENILGYTK